MSVSAFSISQRDTALDAIAIVQNLLSSPALLASIPVCKTARRFVVQLKALRHAAGEQSRLDGPLDRTTRQAYQRTATSVGNRESQPRSSFACCPGR